jgi:hypothetical protein
MHFSLAKQGPTERALSSFDFNICIPLLPDDVIFAGDRLRVAVEIGSWIESQYYTTEDYYIRVSELQHD